MIVQNYVIYIYRIGMGALLIRNKHLDILNKLYWGGGTVSIASDKEHFCVFHVGMRDCNTDDDDDDDTWNSL